MTRRQRKRRTPAGSSPGTLIADPQAPRPLLRVLCYGPDAVHEQTLAGLDELPALLERWPRLWLDFAGLGDAALLERLGALFGLHRLALEDTLNTHQRSKLDAFGGHHFLVARMAEPQADGLGTEQLSLFFGPRFVLSFQERPGDCFDPVRKRLRAGQGRLRASGTDYLVYALLDAVVDAYFPVVEAAGERLEAVEDEIIGHGSPQSLGRLHRLRRDLLTARRAVWPLRDVLASLQREETAATSPETRLYLRDLNDHVVELLDMLETLRELAASLVELHVSAVNTRLNEIIKVLTVISAVFMPPMLVASIYGMNFDRAQPANMPELGWPLGYLFSLLAMAAGAAGMWLWFRRRGWVGPGRDLPRG